MLSVIASSTTQSRERTARTSVPSADIRGRATTTLQTLLDTILRQMMQNLKEAWGPVTEIFPTVDVKESSPNVVQIVAQNEIVIMVVMEIIIGHSSGPPHRPGQPRQTAGVEEICLSYLYRL